jgi:hypothetical protein
MEIDGAYSEYNHRKGGSLDYIKTILYWSIVGLLFVLMIMD